MSAKTLKLAKATSVEDAEAHLADLEAELEGIDAAQRDESDPQKWLERLHRSEELPELIAAARADIHLARADAVYGAAMNTTLVALGEAQTRIGHATLTGADRFVIRAHEYAGQLDKLETMFVGIRAAAQGWTARNEMVTLQRQLHDQLAVVHEEQEAAFALGAERPAPELPIAVNPHPRSLPPLRQAKAARVAVENPDSHAWKIWRVNAGEPVPLSVTVLEVGLPFAVPESA